MRSLLLLLVGRICATLVLSLSVDAGKSPHPHIVHILVDDLGWSEWGFRREGSAKEDASTPFVDALVREEALYLDRHYVHKICSPSRCAIQSGRAPVHVNVQNVKPEYRNAKDPVGGYQGMPINMTGMAEHMRAAGYKTHLVGKWDVGMATSEHTPKARGYDNFLGYWHHSNDYWSYDEESCGFQSIKDLWRSNASYDGPAYDLENGHSCGQKNQSPESEICVFEEETLSNEVLRIIDTHDPSDSLFLFYSLHLTHMPLQCPDAYLEQFAHIDDTYRRSMHAMVRYVDDVIKGVLTKLKSSGLWENALVTIHSDNGGEIMFAGICGGNNWPLRGGKFANWEGGIRVGALVTGGLLPRERYGKTENGLVTAWDWLATYVSLAGGDPTDRRAEKAGLPPIDSIDQWPLISGANATAPRKRIVIGDTSAETPNGDGKTLVGGIIRAEGDKLWKLLVGAADKLHLIAQDVRTGPSWPNTSSHLVPLSHTRTCGRKTKHGCLFDLNQDPYEMESVAETNADIFMELLEEIDREQKAVYSPDRGQKDKGACDAAKKRGGWWGPWLGY